MAFGRRGPVRGASHSVAVRTGVQGAGQARASSPALRGTWPRACREHEGRMAHAHTLYI